MSTSQPSAVLRVDGPGVEHRLDVGPVPGAIEEGLEHREVGRGQDRNRRPANGTSRDMSLGVPWKRCVAKNRSSGRVVPEESHLAVAFDEVEIGVGPPHSLREQLEDRPARVSSTKMFRSMSACTVGSTMWYASASAPPNAWGSAASRERGLDRDDVLGAAWLTAAAGTRAGAPRAPVREMLRRARAPRRAGARGLPGRASREPARR